MIIDAFFSVVDIAVGVIQFISLAAVSIICICRINAMGSASRRTLKGAYLILAGGSFSLLLTTIVGNYDGYTALYSVGVAMAFAVDRRKSLCYDQVMQ
jgi:hypothetical protein